MVSYEIFQKNFSRGVFQKRRNCTRPSESCRILFIFEKLTRANFPKLHSKPYYYLFLKLTGENSFEIDEVYAEKIKVKVFVNQQNSISPYTDID